MSWVTDNWIPLTIVGGLVGVSWYAGKHFDESESYNADEGIQVPEGYNEWWDELDNIRSQYRPDNFFNRRLGNPKWEDGILQQMFKDGWTPKQALSSWKHYNGAVGHFKRPPLIQATTKICKNCGEQGHNSRSCTNERVREIKYANDKSTRLKLSRKINALFKLGEGEQNTTRYINYGLGALAAGRGWDSPKMDFPIHFEHHGHPYVDNSGKWKLVEKHWRDIQDMRDDLGVDDFKEMIDTTKWEIGQPNWNTYMAESYNADEGLWNDASKEQRLKWLKDAIPSIGDKYADYTWRELTPRLQEEMADESYDAESYNADSDNAFAICDRKKQFGVGVFDRVKKMRKCKSTDNTNYYEIDYTFYREMADGMTDRNYKDKALLCDTCVKKYKPFIGESVITNPRYPNNTVKIHDVKLIGGNADYLKDEIQKNRDYFNDKVMLAMGRDGKKLHLGRVHTINHLGNPVYGSCGVENRYGVAWQQMVREVPMAEMKNTTCKKCLKTINSVKDRIEQLENELETYDAESYDTETFAAYVSKADTQRVRQLLKQEFPNLKFSVVKDGGRMSVSIMAGDIDFSDINDDVPRTKRHWERWGNPKPVFDGRLDINQYHLDGYNPKYTPLFEKIVSIMKGEDWFDHSDSQTDYFHTAYYIDLNIGKWNKPYEYKPTIKKGTRPTLESLVYKQGYGDDALTGLKGAYDEETFEAKGYEPNKPYYATMHTERPTTVMHPIKCGHYKMVMGGTGVWEYPTFYDSIEEMVEGELFVLADAILADTEQKELIEQYKNLKTVGEARKWLSKTTGTKLNFAPCFKKEYDYDSKALNALPITPIPFDSFDAETFEAEKSYQEKIPSFTDKDIWNQGFYEQKVYPLGNENEPQKLLTPIENGIPLRESGSIFSVPKINYDSVKDIQITWGELLKLGKKEHFLILGGSRYHWKTMKTVFKKLPKNTIMQIKAFENVPCVITFTYEGQEWYYTQAPHLDYWERDEIRGKYRSETFEASAVARKKAKTPVEKVLLHEELMNQAARNEMITKLTYDLAMRRGVHRQPMRTIKEAEYDSKLKKEFGDD